MGLRRTQRNELFGAIEESGMEPSAFQIKNDGDFMILSHQPTGSEFSIESSGGDLYLRSTVEGSAENDYDRQSMAWEDLLALFSQWAEEVKVEADAPDLWDEVLRGTEFFGNAPRQDIRNTPFTVAERNQIASQLREIKDYVKESCTLTAKQTARMEEAFDEAGKASERIGRKDWILLFGGTLLSLVTSTILPAHVVEEILLMTAQNIGYIFGLPPQIP
jgi:hypothetical protein